MYERDRGRYDDYRSSSHSYKRERERDSRERRDPRDRDHSRERRNDRSYRDIRDRRDRREYRDSRDRDNRDYFDDRRRDHDRRGPPKRPRVEEVKYEEPPPEEPKYDSDGTLVRKSRWGPESEKVSIPGLPTSLPSDLTNDQIENYIIHMRIEEINRTIRMGNYVPRYKRSPSPPPTYGSDGRRNNTREIRYRTKLEDEQHRLVEYGMKHIIGFRPPIDYKRAQQVQEKVYIPQDQHPGINFIGLLIGPRGNTLKKMERETGAKISIRGKGSVKEGKIKSETSRQAGDDDALHALVSGDSEDRVKACITMILKVIETAASVPEGQNELKRQQLLELAKLNGNLRDEDNQICGNCGAPGHRRFECPEIANFTSTLVCRICNSIGHLAKDCLQRNDPAVLQAASKRDKTIDDEYAELMAELGGGSSNPMVAPPTILHIDPNEKLYAGGPRIESVRQQALNGNINIGMLGYDEQPPVPPPAPTSIQPPRPPGQPAPPSYPAPPPAPPPDN